ncbi:WW domain-containing protein [Kocuria palustris]|nr:WW domain-containing protein [Kocuria palustris]
MIPWTTTPLGDSPWLLVIGKNGDGHFYYNTTTRESQWELPLSLAPLVGVDTIAPAFAKARGYDHYKASERKDKEKLKQEKTEDDIVLVEQTEDDVIETETTAIEAKPEEVTVPTDVINLVLTEVLGEEEAADEDENEPTVIATSGLVSGYSSSDDDSDEDNEENEEPEQLPGQPEEAETEQEQENIDEVDDTAANADFFELLGRFQADPYSEWLLFSETHIEALALEPAYYAVPPERHHKVFTQWAAQKVEAAANAADNDTTELPDDIQYLEYLGDHKQEINKCASYLMFYNQHTLEIDAFNVATPQKTALYTKMYEMLREFLAFSKQHKRENPQGNAKVAYLQEYVNNLSDSDVAALNSLDSISWDAIVPVLSPRTTRAAINFIVGPAKRAQCYESRRSGGRGGDAARA